MTQGPKDITAILISILESHPQGIREYELIHLLKDEPYHVFSESLALSDSLVMFQTHFYLFNQLYQLRDQLREEQSADLLISASCICLQPYLSGEAALDKPDKLREYYLDWQQGSRTAKQEVDSLIDQFWRQFSGLSLDKADRENALTVLELPSEASTKQIKQQYRRLMHQHHPDKGGDTRTCQRLTDAYLKLV